MNKKQEELWQDMEGIADRVLFLRNCFQNDLYQLHKDKYITTEALTETVSYLTQEYDELSQELDDWVFDAEDFLVKMIIDIKDEEEAQNEQ